MSNVPSDRHAEEHKKPKSAVIIHIDNRPYEVPKGNVSGEQLRLIPQPPIGDDRDLWEEKGHKDKLIENDDVVKLSDGLVIYSVPSTINPG